VAYRDCEEKVRLLDLYYQEVEAYALLVSEIGEVAGSRDHVRFVQLLKRSMKLRSVVKRARNNMFKHRREHGC
jgi:hypothetical protein